MDVIGPEAIRASAWEWLASGLALILMVSVATAGSGQSVFGVWQHPENGGRIEVYPCAQGRLCIKIVTTGDGQQTDAKNPDQKLRSRSIIGMTIMSGAERGSDGSWTGRLYNRTDGQYYDGTLTPAGNDKLKLTGCVMIVLCRTLIWQRVPKPPPS